MSNEPSSKPCNEPSSEQARSVVVERQRAGRLAPHRVEQLGRCVRPAGDDAVLALVDLGEPGPGLYLYFSSKL